MWHWGHETQRKVNAEEMILCCTPLLGSIGMLIDPISGLVAYQAFEWIGFWPLMCPGTGPAIPEEPSDGIWVKDESLEHGWYDGIF